MLLLYKSGLGTSIAQTGLARHPVSFEPIDAREEEASQFYRHQREIIPELEIYTLAALQRWNMFAPTLAPPISMDWKLI